MFLQCCDLITSHIGVIQTPPSIKGGGGILDVAFPKRRSWRKYYTNKGDNWYTDRLHRFLLTKNVSLKTVTLSGRVTCFNIDVYKMC